MAAPGAAMTFAGFMSRWTIALVLACRGPTRTQAPPLDAPPPRSCASVLESSCDSGYASCGIEGECWCYVGPELVACAVPCIDSPAPSCHEVGCDGFDTFECAIATGECWCRPKDGGEAIGCEIDGCG